MHTFFVVARPFPSFAATACTQLLGMSHSTGDWCTRPACGGGTGWGVAPNSLLGVREGVQLSRFGATPLLSPPPQGGRKQSGDRRARDQEAGLRRRRIVARFVHSYSRRSGEPHPIRGLRRHPRVFARGQALSRPSPEKRAPTRHPRSAHRLAVLGEKAGLRSGSGGRSGADPLRTGGARPYPESPERENSVG